MALLTRYIGAFVLQTDTFDFLHIKGSVESMRSLISTDDLRPNRWVIITDMPRPATDRGIVEADFKVLNLCSLCRYEQ